MSPTACIGICEIDESGYTVSAAAVGADEIFGGRIRAADQDVPPGGHAGRR